MEFSSGHLSLTSDGEDHSSKAVNSFFENYAVSNRASIFNETLKRQLRTLRQSDAFDKGYLKCCGWVMTLAVAGLA